MIDYDDKRRVLSRLEELADRVNSENHDDTSMLRDVLADLVAVVPREPLDCAAKGPPRQLGASFSTAGGVYPQPPGTRDDYEARLRAEIASVTGLLDKSEGERAVALATLARVERERDDAVALLREARVEINALLPYAEKDFNDDSVSARRVSARIDALLARTAHGEARVCPTCGLDDPVLHPCDATGTAYPCFDDFHRYVAARRCAEPGCEIRGLTRKREWRCVPHLQPATPPAGTDEGSRGP